MLIITLQRNMLPPSSGKNENGEDGGSIFLRNFDALVRI
jgi:hypothetical protein